MGSYRDRHGADTHVSTVIAIFQAQRTLPVIFHIRRWVQFRTILSASVTALELKERTIFILEIQGGKNSFGGIVSKWTRLEEFSAASLESKAHVSLCRTFIPGEKRWVQKHSWVQARLRNVSYVTASEWFQVTETKTAAFLGLWLAILTLVVLPEMGGVGGCRGVGESGSPGPLSFGAGMIFFIRGGCSVRLFSSRSCHWA